MGRDRTGSAGGAQALARIERVITRALEFSLAMALLVIVGLVVTLVVMRYAFNSSITGANEAITILFVYTTALGAAIAVGKGEHIAISFAVEWLPDRAKTFVDATVLILIGILNAVMVVYSIGWIRITGGYLMPATGLPRMFAQACVPIGCSLAVLYCLVKLTMRLTTSHSPSEVPSAV